LKSTVFLGKKNLSRRWKQRKKDGIIYIKEKKTK
jgi:hypothetical protein